MNHNLNIERTVLASLIFAPESIASAVVKLVPQDFYYPPHQDIYAAIVALEHEKLPIDEGFIQKKMGEKFNQDAFFEVFSSSSVYGVEQYINELKTYRQKRDLIHLATSVHANVEEAADVSSVISDLMKNIEAIGEAGKIDGYKYKSIVDANEELTEFILPSLLPLPRGTVSILAAKGGTGGLEERRDLQQGVDA